MRLSKLIIPALTAISLFAALYSAHGQEFMLRSHSSSMEPVDIMLDGKIHLRIPKAYLVEVKNWLGGHQDSVYIEAVLPDLNPLKDKENLTIDESLVVQIRLQHPISKQGIQSNIKSIHKLKPYLKSTGFGLEQLSESYYDARRQGSAPSMGLFSSDIHFFAASENRYAKINCLKRIRAKCTNHTNLGPDIMGLYIFDRNLVPERWQELDGKVNKLVEKFIFRAEAGDSK